MSVMSQTELAFGGALVGIPQPIKSHIKALHLDYSIYSNSLFAGVLVKIR
jgi:hypothetical protein